MPSMIELQDSLMPLRFMAKYLRVPAAWLKDEAVAGRVPHLSAGGTLLFNPTATVRALSERAARVEEGSPCHT